MTNPAQRLAVVAASLLVVACAQMPIGPSVAVMPGPYKPFDVFTQDDEMCRGWAAHSIGIPGNEAAAQAFIASTAVGMALGALVGAAAGGDRSAGSGAAAGAAMGAMAGTGQSAAAAWNAQRRYDIAYSQCMYARGNVVPQYGYRPASPVTVPPPPPPPSR
jgi:hypothetical protein